MSDVVETKRIPLSDDVRIARGVIEGLRNAGIGESDPDFAELFDSESDIDERLVRMARAARRAEAMAEAMDGIIKENQARKKRHLARAESILGQIQWALGEVGKSKIEAFDLTLSLTKPRAALVGNGDASALPDALRRVKYEPDKLKIKAALEAGQEVPGYSLGNGPPALTVRYT